MCECFWVLVVCAFLSRAEQILVRNLQLLMHCTCLLVKNDFFSSEPNLEITLSFQRNLIFVLNGDYKSQQTLDHSKYWRQLKCTSKLQILPLIWTSWSLRRHECYLPLVLMNSRLLFVSSLCLFSSSISQPDLTEPNSQYNTRFALKVFRGVLKFIFISRCVSSHLSD